MKSFGAFTYRANKRIQPDLQTATSFASPTECEALCVA